MLENDSLPHGAKSAKVNIRTALQIHEQFPKSCRRYCPSRIGKIYFADTQSGLSDRKVILKYLSHLAGYLCAELVMPPPNEHLDPSHNFNLPISEDMEWSDLVNITFIQDGSSVIHSDADSLEDGMSIRQWSDKPAIHLNGPKYETWLHIVSENGKMKDDFERIQKFSFEHDRNTSKGGFIWEIHKNWYDSDIWLTPLPMLDPEVREYLGSEYSDEMRPFWVIAKSQDGMKKERTGCMYTNKDTIPASIAMLQRSLMDHIKRNSPTNSLFGRLHLRRGDTIQECDTSLETMHKYFACSFNGTENFARNITLLLTSDEDNNEYRQGIFGLIEDYPHVTILDIDDIVKKVVLREAIDEGLIKRGLENNYVVYEVESILRDWRQSFVKFHMVQRRSKCRPCLSLTNILHLADQNLSSVIL